ncbi:MAG TPA: type II toxin-antitoxin system PemK/MazF family toxin [Terriglobales bacterium]|nr:type II toxin-antitoxin system PemK/MazF family toxin [Terriglobales bacterium]
MTPRRGEIWWASLDPTVGSEINKTRPCLMLSDNILNERRRTLVVIPLSSSPRPNPPLLMPLDCGNRSTVAVVDQIRAVSKERLRQRLGVVPPERLEHVEKALKHILELS